MTDFILKEDYQKAITLINQITNNTLVNIIVSIHGKNPPAQCYKASDLLAYIAQIFFSQKNFQPLKIAVEHQQIKLRTNLNEVVPIDKAKDEIIQAVKHRLSKFNGIYKVKFVTLEKGYYSFNPHLLTSKPSLERSLSPIKDLPRDDKAIFTFSAIKTMSESDFIDMYRDVVSASIKGVNVNREPSENVSTQTSGKRHLAETESAEILMSLSKKPKNNTSAVKTPSPVFFRSSQAETGKTEEPNQQVLNQTFLGIKLSAAYVIPNAEKATMEAVEIPTRTMSN